MMEKWFSSELCLKSWSCVLRWVHLLSGVFCRLLKGFIVLCVHGVFAPIGYWTVFFFFWPRSDVWETFVSLGLPYWCNINAWYFCCSYRWWRSSRPTTWFLAVWEHWTTFPLWWVVVCSFQSVECLWYVKCLWLLSGVCVKRVWSCMKWMLWQQAMHLLFVWFQDDWAFLLLSCLIITTYMCFQKDSLIIEDNSGRAALGEWHCVVVLLCALVDDCRATIIIFVHW